MNEETAALMTSDRCGVPDILDNEEEDVKRRKRYTFVGKVERTRISVEDILSISAYFSYLNVQNSDFTSYENFQEKL